MSVGRENSKKDFSTICGILLMLTFSISKIMADDYFAAQKEQKIKRYIIFDMDSYVESGKPIAPKSLKLFQNLSRDKNVILHYKAEDPNTLLKLKNDYPRIVKLANSISKLEGATLSLCSENHRDFIYLKSGDLQKNRNRNCNRYSESVDLSSNQNINKLATKLHSSLSARSGSLARHYKLKASVDSIKEYPGDILLDSNIPLGLIPRTKLSSGKKYCYLYDGLLYQDLKKIPMPFCIKYAKGFGSSYKMIRSEAGVDECFKILGSGVKKKVKNRFCEQHSFQDFHAIKYDLYQACIRARKCLSPGILNNINSLSPNIQVLKKLIIEAESIEYKSTDWALKRKELLNSIDKIYQQLGNCFSTIFEAKVASSSNPPTKLQLSYQIALGDLVDNFSKDLGSTQEFSISKDDLLAKFNQCAQDYYKVDFLNQELLNRCVDKAKVEGLHQIISGLKDEAKLLDLKCQNLSFEKDNNAMGKYNTCIGSLGLLKKFEKVKYLARKRKVDIDKNLFEDFGKCIESKTSANRCSMLVLGKKSLLAAPEVTKAYVDMPLVQDIVYNKNYRDSFEKCLLRVDGGDKINEIEMDSCINNYKRKIVTYMKKENLSLQAMHSLAIDFKKSKKILSRDINTFHWTSPIFTFGHPDTYASVMTNLFSKNLSPGGDMMGRGLYASSDPTHTRDYGNKLLQLKIKKGDSFLDLRGNGCEGKSFYISEESQKLMAKAGCQSVPKKYCYRKRFFTKSSKCHDLFIGAIKGLDISFIAYQYGSEFPRFCKNNPAVAFIMVKTPGIQNSYTVSYGAFKKGTQKYKELSELGNISWHISRYLEDFQKEDAKTLCKKWGSLLFGCNCSKDNTYPEDQIPKIKR